MSMTVDEVWPRDTHYRWRIYRLRRGVLDVVRATGDERSVFPAILDAREQGDLLPIDAVGVLDVTCGQLPAPEAGTWIVSPFGPGRR